MSFRVWHKKLISQGAGFDVYSESADERQTEQLSGRYRGTGTGTL